MKYLTGRTLTKRSFLKTLSIFAVVTSLAASLGISTSFGDPAPGPLDPTDLVALKPHLGETVEVKGVPTGVGSTASGSPIFLNFARKAHSALTIVFFTNGGRAGKVKSEEEIKPFVGKQVTIKGELNAFKDDLQIVLQSVDDIHVVQ